MNAPRSAYRSNHFDRVGLMLLMLAALAAGIGMRDPAPPDEPRFVLAAKDMVENGHWLFPHRGSELYSHKPPVFMWLQASTFLLTRDWRTAFLLPSLLASLGTLWLTWDLARRLWNPRIALYAVAALFATLQFGLQAKRAQIDIVLLLFTTLALWAFVRHLLVRRDRSLAALGGLAAGIGTVTKGVGFLPLLLFVPWRALPARLRGTGPVAGMWVAAGFIAGASIWLAPMLWMALGSQDAAVHGYVEDLLFRQTGTRYANPWHHQQPPWYFLQVIGTLWLPGVILAPWLLPAWWRRLRRREPRQWLLLGWGLLVLLFFSLSPGKREVYILPALPAFCLAAAPLLRGLLRQPGPRKALAGYMILLALGLVVIGAGGLADVQGLASILEQERAISASDQTRLFAWLLGMGAGVGAAAAVFARHRPALATVLSTAILLTGYGVGLTPALDASSSGRRLMQAVGTHLDADAQLGLVAWTEQLMLQADRPVRDFGFERPVDAQWNDAGRWLQRDPSHRWLLVPASALRPCLDRRLTVAIGRSNRRDWYLVPGTAWSGHCPHADRQHRALPRADDPALPPAAKAPSP